MSFISIISLLTICERETGSLTQICSLIFSGSYEYSFDFFFVVALIVFPIENSSKIMISMVECIGFFFFFGTKGM